MNIADKLGELDSSEKIFGYEIVKSEGCFVIIVRIQNKFFGGPHSIQTKKHRTLTKAVDEAIEIFQEHLSDCSLC